MERLVVDRQIVKAQVSGRKNAWGEWVVRAWTKAGRYPLADYYTEDKEDAENTAKAMVNREWKKGKEINRTK